MSATPPTTLPNPGANHTPLSRLSQCAPPGVGLKALRPLRGPGYAPSLDPDTSARRAPNPAGTSKNEVSTP